MNDLAAAGIAMLVVLSGGAAQVADSGTVVGRPQLTLLTTAEELTWGSEQTIDLFVANDPVLVRGGPERFEERVTTARNVTLRVRDAELSDELAAAVDVSARTRPLGDVPRGSTGPIAFELAVGSTLDPGTYEIPVSLTFEYTSTVQYDAAEAPEYTERTRTTIDSIQFTIPDRPRFELDYDESQAVAQGESGVLSLGIRNAGNATATDLAVTVAVDNASLFVGSEGRGSSATSFYVPSLEPGDNRTVRVTVGAYGATTPGVYLGRVEIRYRDELGLDHRTRPIRFGINVTTG